MSKITKYKAESIVHIGLPFNSHDGEMLKNRFMCIFTIENNDLVLMPMSTFHSEKIKKWKLKQSKTRAPIFEYSQKHGNNRDGYLKCNQFYFLSKKEYDIFPELRICNKMNKERFQELQDYVKKLQKNKIKFLEKRIVFENSFALQQKEQDSESIFTDDELVRMQKIEQKNLKKIRKYEKVLKKVQQVAQAANEDDNEFDDYEC